MNYVKSCLIITMLLGIGYACLGDLNEDGDENIMDILLLANCILDGNCDDYFVPILNNPTCYQADMNLDGNYNIFDVVILSACVLAQNCDSIIY